MKVSHILFGLLFGAASLTLVGCGVGDASRLSESPDVVAEPPDFEQNAINLAIPDQGGGQVVLPMVLQSTGLVGGLGIELHIDHTYIGDLVVYLDDPTGARLTLHDREGGSTQNISKIYGTGGQALDEAAVMLHEALGTWKLIIEDQAAQDVGKLQYVKFLITKV